MMRKILIATLVASGIIHGMASGEIRNGYESDIHDARLTLNNLSIMLENNQENINTLHRKLSPHQKKRIKLKIEEMKKLIYYYELTEKMFEEFRIIAPELYHEMDTIRNAKGTITDVYVRFMSVKDMYLSSKGWTEVDPCVQDQHACQSVFGKHTVCVSVCAGQQSLCTLAHEFGHLRYLVPHLSTYMAYYKKRYQKDYFNSRCIGHHPGDPSGKMAESYQGRFRQCYKIYRGTER